MTDDHILLDRVSRANEDAACISQSSVFVEKQRYGFELNVIEQTLDAVPTATLVLQRDGTLEFTNAAARALWARGGWQMASGRLHRLAQLQPLRLQEIAAAAAAGIAQRVGLWIPRAQGLETAILLLSRLAPDSMPARHWQHAELLATIHLDHPVHTREARLEALAARCRLTPAEVQVLRRLATGETVDAIAQAHGVRTSTVRTQVRHLLGKTGAPRMLDLVRMVGG